MTNTNTKIDNINKILQNLCDELNENYKHKNNTGRDEWYYRKGWGMQLVT